MSGRPIIKRVLVCGCRDADPAACANDLEAILADYRPEYLIHGDARGADQAARIYAANRPHTKEWAFPADWKTHGKAAGPIRNQKMLDEAKPEFVVAFWDGKSRGTLDMLSRAAKADVPAWVEPVPSRLSSPGSRT